MRNRRQEKIPKATGKALDRKSLNRYSGKSDPRWPGHTKPELVCFRRDTSYAHAFFFVAAFALAAVLRLLRIMTMLKKEPTMAEPRRRRMTGMRIAQTRGRKKFCKGWSSSTKGWGRG